LTIFLSIAICWSVKGQQFSFIVEATGFEPTQSIVLKKYHGAEEIPIDTSLGSGKFTFNVQSDFGVDGLYLLTASRSEVAEILINSTEKGLSVLVDKAKLKEGLLTIRNSPENTAYERFVSLYLKYEQAFYSTAGNAIDPFDRKLITTVSDQAASMEAIQAAFNHSMDSLIERSSSTFTASVLCPMVKKALRNEEQKDTFETYFSFLNQHFWDGSILSNSLVLNHFLINESLKNYFRFFVPKRESAIKESIDLLHALSGKNDQVSQYIRSFLLRNFLNANANSLSTYVNQLSDDGACGLNLSEEHLEKLNSLNTSVDSGSVIPDVSLADLNQNPVPLSAVYRQNRLTIVLFWSANCAHCTNQIPDLINIYQLYKLSGLEIYAINLDENKFDWRDYLALNETPWVNVSDVGSVRTSETVRSFQIQRTPTLFIVNDQGVVLGRDLFGDALSDFLTDYLTPK
jgi:thiol-disulfide isomerase/thioredoxin